MECFDRTQPMWISSGSLIRNLRIFASRSLVYSTTYRCNLRCIHCYLGQRLSPLRGRYPEINEIGLSSLTKSRRWASFFFMTGGEPFLREDFTDIYRHAKKNGLIVTVFTEWTLMTDRVLGLFEDLPPRFGDNPLRGGHSLHLRRALRAFQDLMKDASTPSECFWSRRSLWDSIRFL